MLTTDAPDFSDPNWEPLRLHLGVTCQPDENHGPCVMDEWMWICRESGCEVYKNRDTREHLWLPTPRESAVPLLTRGRAVDDGS